MGTLVHHQRWVAVNSAVLACLIAAMMEVYTIKNSTKYVKIVFFTTVKSFFPVGKSSILPH